MMILGVDIGGTKIAAGIVDGDTGAVAHAERTPTVASEGGAAVLARAIALARRVMETVNVPLDAVGIGAGGQIDYRTGVVLSATDILPGWAGTRLAESFAAAFGVPAFADNDVNAFALGEHRFGAGQGATDAVFLALGTGVGGAIFTNGKLHRGKRGTGGELGHLILSAPENSGDNYWTIEAATCGDALVSRYRNWATGAVSPKTRLAEPITGHAVGESAKRYPGSDAFHAVRTVGESLGIGLASFANILDTERFVIGGGLSDLGDLLLAPARETFNQYVLPLYRDTEIIAAKLGTNSSIVGAATVALCALSERNPL